MSPETEYFEFELSFTGSTLNNRYILHKSLTLNQWFKFEPVVAGCSTTWLKLNLVSMVTDISVLENLNLQRNLILQLFKLFIFL